MYLNWFNGEGSDENKTQGKNIDNFQPLNKFVIIITRNNGGEMKLPVKCSITYQVVPRWGYAEWL